MEEAIALYRGQGYDFLAITDHRKYCPPAEKNGLRVIPGTEFDRNYMSPNIAYPYSRDRFGAGGGSGPGGNSAANLGRHPRRRRSIHCRPPGLVADDP
ncbi:MAG: hypothetical protein ACLR23_20785 [Clostridia bacterium]